MQIKRWNLTLYRSDLYIHIQYTGCAVKIGLKSERLEVYYLRYVHRCVPWNP